MYYICIYVYRKIVLLLYCIIVTYNEVFIEYSQEIFILEN